MNAVVIHVIGTPAPQGSKRAFVVAGRAVMAESSTKVKPWRQDVITATQNLSLPEWDGAPLEGPVTARIDFYLPRPRYHYRTGRHAGHLKPTAPTYVDKKPDVDKLVRSTLDGLKEAGIYRDDAQVAELTAVKWYADAATGARITLTPLHATEHTPTPAEPAEAQAGGLW